jgi:hypothetical protein
MAVSSGALRDVVDPLPETDDRRRLLRQCSLNAVHNFDHVCSGSGCHGCNSNVQLVDIFRPQLRYHVSMVTFSTECNALMS